jgi:hypothetical protein
MARDQFSQQERVTVLLSVSHVIANGFGGDD